VFVQIEQQFQQSANNVEGKVCTRLRQGPNKSRTKAKAITKANRRGGGWKVGEMESGNWGWCWAVGGG